MTQAPLIALIDDDAALRVSLDGLVRSLGFRAASFDSAEAFLAAPEAAQAQCVVSDLQMGGMDGISLARSIEERLHGRVILISAQATAALRAEAQDAGVRHFLSKPFDGEELIACIEATLALG